MATSMMQKNYPYIKQQFTAVLGDSSVVVKFVCIAVSICYFLSFSKTAVDFLTVTPGYVMPPNFWFWTYFTHSFMEVHIWNVLIDIAVIVLYGKLLEPLWGALQMLVFYLVVNSGVALLTTLVYLCIYLVTKNEAYWFQTHIHGLPGYIAGFSVAVKQVMPDHVLVNSPFGKLRNKHIPMWLLILAFFVRLAGGVDGPFPIMFGMGILVSWIYLRFYQKHSNGNRGDMADSFTFASFFPDTLQPVIGIISNTLFAALVKIKICKKPQRKYNMSSPTTITVSLPGTDPQDAERRRQVALKALNERLSKVEPATNWPSMEDAPESSVSPPVSPSGGAKAESTALLQEVRVDPKPKESTEKQASATPKLPVPDFKEAAKSTQSGSS